MQFYHLVVLWILSGCLFSTKSKSLRDEWKSRIRLGLKEGQRLVDIFSSEQRSKIFNHIHLMTNFMGTVDSLVTLIKEYDPKTEKTYFKEIKRHFTDLNRQIESKTYRQFGSKFKNIYFELRNIEFSFGIFNRFLEKLEELECSSSTECQQKLKWTIEIFKNDFDIEEYYTHIIKTTLKGSRFSGVSLIRKVKETSGCNEHSILNFGINLLLKLFKAEQIIVVYRKFAKEYVSPISSIHQWSKDVYEFRDSLLSTLQECSKEKACTKKCKTGHCLSLSKENRDICICPMFFNGEDCKLKSQISLAKDIVSVMAILQKVPKLRGIIELPLISNFLSASMNCVRTTLDTIHNKNIQSIKNRIYTIEDLGSFYGSFLRMIYLIRQANGLLKCQSYFQASPADLIKVSEGLKNVLFSIDHYFNHGHPNESFQIAPLLSSVIRRHKSEACSAVYKTKIDNLWRLFHVTQSQGFSALLEVLHALGKSSESVTRLYKTRVSEQIKFAEKTTCNASIDHSITVQCDAFHLLQSISIKNKCKHGYFRQGSQYITCGNITSTCKPCNCNNIGSQSILCNSESGKCRCKPQFSGHRCEREQFQDCKLSKWSVWSTCSKTCGIGGVQKRFRHIVLQPVGNASKCLGQKTEKRKCFLRCCDGTILCSENPKCINKIQCNEFKPKGCSYLDKKKHKSGIYRIYPDNDPSFKVYCEMEKAGGGWTVIQRRLNGKINFYRGWAEYEIGFGDLNTEFWLGNMNIHRLTSAGNTFMRIDLEDVRERKAYANYTSFSVGDDATKYRLYIYGYSGNAGNSIRPKRHHYLPFSTYDRDNDSVRSNCAKRYHGAWWYTGCGVSNLNGLYHGSGMNGISWYYWKREFTTIEKSSMMIRRHNM